MHKNDRAERGAVRRNGDLGRIRTSDQQLRRLLLYPLSYEAVGAV